LIPRVYMGVGRREKYLTPKVKSNPLLGCPAHSLITTTYELSRLVEYVLT